MLETLQQFGKELGRDLARGWESLTEGWRELLSRSANALTPFRRRAQEGELIPADAPRWSLLAGDVVDTGREIVVRVEMPGVAKEDCDIVIDGSTLYVRGEKRSDSTYIDGSYYLRQCAFGSFERASAEFRNGVLVVRLPKTPGDKPQRIRVH